MEGGAPPSRQPVGPIDDSIVAFQQDAADFFRQHRSDRACRKRLARSDGQEPHTCIEANAAMQA